MNVKTSFFVSLFVLCTGVAHAQYHQINDISYKQSTDAYAKERCKLDVYYPTDKVIENYRSCQFIHSKKAVKDDDAAEIP